MALSSLLGELEAAKDELMAAQAHYSEAATDTATAKANLDFRRAEIICQGIDGKNAEQREAALRLELSEQYAELLQLENELTRVRCRLEIAQIRFTAVRYQVRAFEALGGAA